MKPWLRKSAPWRRWNERRLRTNIGLYLHIPFCLKRCSYCDFLTYTDKRPAGLAPKSYVEALLSEIERRGAWAQRVYGSAGRQVDSVFFGGGTPTYLAPEQLAACIRAVYASFPMAADALEFSCEANPETITPDYLHALHEAGVTRISVGVQSVQDRHLRRMNRPHRWAGTAQQLEWVARGPFKRFSFDLIYGLPGMTVAEVKESCAVLLEFGPRHISAYELIYEPGTALYAWSRRYPNQLASEQLRLEQHSAIERSLRGAGLYRYEISNYCAPGQESRHNLRYWRGGDYIGLGVGAASRIGSMVANNPRGFEQYRAGLARIGTEQDALTAEAMVSAGVMPVYPSETAVPDRQIRSRAETPAPPLAPPADCFLQMRTRSGTLRNGQALEQRWLTDGLLRAVNGRLEVTSAGLAFADMFHKKWA